nr:MAG TPA: hypothetical protein [Caudoviricetes sp.]
MGYKQKHPYLSQIAQVLRYKIKEVLHGSKREKPGRLPGSDSKRGHRKDGQL